MCVLPAAHAGVVRIKISHSILQREMGGMDNAGVFLSKPQAASLEPRGHIIIITTIYGTAPVCQGEMHLI